MKVQHVTTSIPSSSKEKLNYFRSTVLNTTLCAGRFIIPPTLDISENTAVCPRAHASVSLNCAPAGHALWLTNKGAPPQRIINPATGSTPRKRSTAFPNYFRSTVLNTTLCAVRLIIPPTLDTSENTAVYPRAPASFSLRPAPAGHKLGLTNKGSPPHRIINPAVSCSSFANT
ncbi:hypothetical protein CDAR_402621 [Caerostris darwini]|uniref:Uncharacterized protein n=1 Tax=Caerostris darwini TaxID=1538125 RepID=A0AAV4RX09_9ARAC|nr:hypothetical protein CDAR_402621 [Caerostris darwini]